jgi:thymidylate synthase
MNKIDKQYQDLLQDILDNGVEKKDRTGTGTISVFGRQIRHKMSEGFPLLTTKKMPWKSIVTELLWFLQGNTNIKWLVDNGCNIWNGDAYKNYESNWLKENPPFAGPYTDPCLTQEEFINKIKTDDEFANKWGELGPIYGKQWRKWKTSDTKSLGGTFWGPTTEITENSIDQIQNLINDLKTNPDSRRLMVNAWNVRELDQMVLPPCHYGFQVYTRELTWEEQVQWVLKNTDVELENLYVVEEIAKDSTPKRAISLMWNQRSVDTFLGLPFNIASYGLLLEIIAKEVNMVPDELIGNLGDVHLYSNHIEQAKEQIGRDLTLDERFELWVNKDNQQYLDIYNNLSSDSHRHRLLSEKYYGSVKRRTREPFPLPTLKFVPCPITGIDMEYQSIAQFQIENYESHPTIKAPLSN